MLFVVEDGFLRGPDESEAGFARTSRKASNPA
jgi:hypothetical protein